MSEMREAAKLMADQVQAPGARVRTVRQTAAMLVELEAFCETAYCVVGGVALALSERTEDGEADFTARLAWLQATAMRVADALAEVRQKAPAGYLHFTSDELADLERRLERPAVPEEGA